MTAIDPATVENKSQVSMEAGSKPPHPHIVVALDGSTLAELALPYVEVLARAFNAQVTCVCAVEPISSTLIADTSMPGGYVPLDQIYETQDEIRGEDSTYLAGIKQRLAALGIAVDCEEPEAHPADAIVAAAQNHRANVIIMTTHGRSGLGRAILGSVADKVVRTAPCPVLLIRNQAHEASPM